MNTDRDAQPAPAPECGRKCHGFSLVELLVVMAIISILAAMYMVALSKARDQAVRVVAKEGMRQDFIGRFADHANEANYRPPRRNADQTRAECRAAFRQTMDRELVVTRMVYEVRSDAEFRAYWDTVINPDAAGDIEFTEGRLVAYDPEGNRFELPHVETQMQRAWQQGSDVPVAWEFLSTRLGDNNTGSIGANVMYRDGHIQHLAYPGAFPMTPTVARLSRRFMDVYGDKY